jgi:SAM-dependent methyltransferase
LKAGTHRLSAKVPTVYEDGREYDLFSPVGLRPDELLFYTRYAAAAHGPTLELACGTGRLTIPLAGKAIDIVGIDIAESMLSVAREKAAETGVHPFFERADVRNFTLNRQFGLVFFPNNSIAHLHSIVDARACLSRVRQHLFRDGLFIVDFFNPSLPILCRDPSVRFPVKEYQGKSGERVVVTETVRYDPATQISHVRWYFQRNGKEQVCTLDMRIYFPQELDALLMQNGFEIVEKFGDFLGTPFTSESQQQLLVCRPLA